MFFLRLVIYILIISLPLTTFARYERIDRGNLGDDMVEEFSIPVLFGVEFDDLVPDFGDSRGGGTRTHEGQDMRALKGAPIVSPTEAVVIKTGTGSSAGKYVYTANPGGETFRYMHLDYIADLYPGDRLDVGDFIGTVGDTGLVRKSGRDASHLHFEIYQDGSRVNPLAFLFS